MDDGNRRLAMQRRCLREATGPAICDIEAWADHLCHPAAPCPARLDAEDVEEVRRKALSRTPSTGGPLRRTTRPSMPGSSASNVVQRTVVRNSVTPARLVVGYRTSGSRPAAVGDGGAAALHPPHPYQVRRAEGVVRGHPGHASRPRRHAPDQVRSATVQGYTMALSQDELKDLYGNRAIDWAGARPTTRSTRCGWRPRPPPASFAPTSPRTAT